MSKCCICKINESDKHKEYRIEQELKIKHKLEQDEEIMKQKTLCKGT